MVELVKISHRLALKFNQPEKFLSELQRELEALNQHIQSGTAILPYTAKQNHRVLRIILEECFPIPTYGRVLYYFCTEVWPMELHFTREMAAEYLRMRLEPDAHGCLELTAESDSESVPVVRPSRTNAFGEMWPLKVHRLIQQSPNKQVSQLSCSAYIVKHGDYVLQEQFVMQLVKQFQYIFKEEGLALHLTTYSIIALTSDSGLIEVVPNSMSIGRCAGTTATVTITTFFLWKNDFY
eukprot:TRINITY_DN9733_c0_g1_i6.p1 TRINITY_DN9733_c0_g1~~TRINITY_DN9733_c0_g1_i6.p1  ORF type:complete len:238 (+),score=37.38 TRINITY_DN9733_c0_g1_i6:562-1275(+)